MKIGVRSKEEKNKSDQIIFFYVVFHGVHICVDRIKVTLCIF
jgi:hypothetical protein